MVPFIGNTSEKLQYFRIDLYKDKMGIDYNNMFYLSKGIKQMVQNSPNIKGFYL